MTYHLTEYAINDLKEIVQYTLDSWSIDAITCYLTTLLD